MPELPEVEVLVRHLRAVLLSRTVREVRVLSPKIIRPATPASLSRALRGARFRQVERRGKYLVFELESPRSPGQPFRLLGHLGMTGRMDVVQDRAPRPRHAVVELRLDRGRLVFEDVRRFGRLTTDLSPLERLGPEPLSTQFTPAGFHRALQRSSQAIKVHLLDQRVVAGVGNIYASEALHRARISPRLGSAQLTLTEVRRLHRAVRRILAQAIQLGSTVPLNWEGQGNRDGLFYYGKAPEAPGHYVERLQVYDRAGAACHRCGTLIRRIVQAGRSTYFCPYCQSS